jgi:hypothetical protein
LYVAYCQITKERKPSYYVNKIGLEPEKRNKLRDMVAKLSTLKTNMQKSPITIEEDLVDLQAESEKELKELMKEMETFFAQVTSSISNLLNPKRTEIIDESAAEVPQKGGKGADKKPDPKAKAAPAKGKAPAKGQPADLAAYESTLPLTTSGIESIVICVDRRLESLPFEGL